MDWPLALLIILGSFILLLMTGMPIVFCFMAVNIMGLYLFWGGTSGLGMLGSSIFATVGVFTMTAVVLFVFMGIVLFRSGIAPNMLNALDMWVGRLPGRLSLIAVGAGALLGTLTGAEFITVAILGKGLMPEMEKQGYKKEMSMGPILGSGGLAILIPPSDLAVIMGAIGRFSVGRLLMGIIMPGLVMAAVFALYIIPRCMFQPSVAPVYRKPAVPMSEKLTATAKHVLPVFIIVFLVIGVIFLGVATPTEASGTGALGMLLLAAAHKGVNREMLKNTMVGTLEITVMVLFIIAGAAAFTQILAYTGATRGLVELFLALPVAPIFIIVGTQVLVVILGMFMDPVSLMMVTLPLFMPVIRAMGFDIVWFGVTMLISITIGAISPPFGLSLFVMKGVASPGTTMGDIYRASLPWIALSLLVVALVIAFPQIALWLPAQMY